MTLAAVILALRGAVAVAVLTTLVGGVPYVVRFALAAAFGAWAGVLAATGDVGAVAPVADAGALALVDAAGREIAIGATLGVAAALPLVAVAAAGALVDQAARLRRGPYAPMFAVVAGAVFVGIDGHVATIAAIVDSFRVVPQPGIAATIGRLVPIAARLAAPWLITAAVVEIAAGAATRVASRAAAAAPLPAAVPAAIAMITASLVGVLAIAVATAIRS
jgi:flagellar biosynthesis protein FliR